MIFNALHKTVLMVFAHFVPSIIINLVSNVQELNVIKIINARQIHAYMDSVSLVTTQ